MSMTGVDGGAGMPTTEKEDRREPEEKGEGGDVAGATAAHIGGGRPGAEQAREASGGVTGRGVLTESGAEQATKLAPQSA